MFGSLGSLKPGQQGGGRVAKRKHGSADTIGPSTAPRQTVRTLTPLEAQIKKNHDAIEAEARGRKFARDLPEWIVAGQRVGYLSSSGKVCPGHIESVSLEKSEVKFVFADDATVWKRVPFATILSKSNPLRHLALPSDRTQSMSEMLAAAKSSAMDKSILMERLVGKTAFGSATLGRNATGSDGANSSAAPEPGSAPGSERSRSRSPQRQWPEWLAVGQRIGYVSRTSGVYCEVDVDSISETEVKIIFVDDPTVWKGLPFSMILSDKNPLRPIAPKAGLPGDDIVDLDDASDPGSMCSRDGSMSPVAGPANKPSSPTKVQSPDKKQQLPRWMDVGQRVGYLSKSTGKVCTVEIEAVSMEKKEVKIVFVDNRSVWKGIPFSMILSAGNPLKQLDS